MLLTEIFETKHALGGEATIVLTLDATRDSHEIFATLWRQIFTFERQFSRFIPESELSQFNRRAGLEVPVTPEFMNLLRASASLSTQTNGLYNPFILPALQRAGYKQSAALGYEHDVVEDYSSRSVVSIDQLTLSEHSATIPYGTALDMGGCGKGYLADQLADYLDTQALAGYWISLSGDMVTFGVDQHDKPWHAAIQSATSTHEFAAKYVATRSERLGIATSGTFRRSNQPALAAHHIIDPLTGKPAQTDVRLATVVANSALQADVLASCAVIVGSKRAPAFLRKQGALGAFIQTEEGNAQFGQLLANTAAREVYHA